MSKNDLTVFQRLTKVFGFDDGQNKRNRSFNFSKENLLKTDDPAEFEKAKLQAQQSSYLHDKWAKLDSSLYNQSVYYEPNRLAAYYDYESMEFTPEISAALDIYSEESTTVTESGAILNIYSESKRVKSILTDLFENKLDINTNLQMWARNLCKYGDNFVYLKSDPEHGIIGCQQLPNLEIERIEGAQLRTPTERSIPEPTRELRFGWSNRDMEFQSWEIAHFRLLGDDRKLPYGTSLLDKIRRIWKQLLLAEDAMLIYRTSRAPERRVFKVFVGNMDDKDVEAYVQRVANKFKRDVVVDRNNGNVDMRFNQMAIDQDFFIPVRDPSAPSPIETLAGACLSLDTKIPLLDGRKLTLQEIINLWDNGERNLWVYSVDPITGESLTLPITWAGITRKNAEVLKITLDNGETIISTPDHKFVHRTKGFVEAQNLIVGDSLMPFYRKEDYILRKKYSKKYEQIWDNKNNKWVFTHRLVKENLQKFGLINEFYFNDEYKNSLKKTIHHVDNNRFNNNPNNLVLMDSKDHYLYHRHELWSTKEKSDKNKEKISKGLKRYISNLSEEEYKIRMSNLLINSNKNQISKLLEWRKIPRNNKYVGLMISKAFTDERKRKQSEISKKLWENTDYKNKVFSKKQTITFSEKIYMMFVSEFEKTGRVDLTLEVLNKNFDFLSTFKNDNKSIRSKMTNLDEFTHNHVDKMMKTLGFKNYQDWLKKEAIKRGYKNVRAWRYYIDKEQGIKQRRQFFNHKITKIEILDYRLDTGTITVDGDELYSNVHTFALESGIYVKNSNLGEIADIEYIQKKMLSALRIPKAFLGFEEVVGDGKNLALMDIRFARTINRIQKSLIQELNKIALIHLFILGLDDELQNFTLGLSNPSAQAELLRMEQWKEKITLYKDATADQSQVGISPVSHTWAKKNILGMSDAEILLDLQQQRLERGIGFELTNTQTIIKRSGVFDEVDSKYGIPEEERQKLESQPEGGVEGSEVGGMVAPAAPAGGDDAPLNESKKDLTAILGDKKDFLDSFNFEKAQKNIYEIENKIKDILND